MFNPKRVRQLNSEKLQEGPIVYWMSRDQRVQDNWAMLFAQDLANQNKQSLAVIFCLVPKFLGATERQYDFMLRGLEQVKENLEKLSIPFFMLLGNPEEEILKFTKSVKAGAIVCDFSPLKVGRQWKEKLSEKLTVALYEVDAHNIVPCWVASPKQEYGAYTIRPKINKLLPEFLEEMPSVKKHSFDWQGSGPMKWTHAKLVQKLLIDKKVKPVDWIIPGEKAALSEMRNFLHNKLKSYGSDRNDPTKDAQSGLSPYLHFGQLSAQRVALEASLFGDLESVRNFLEELIIRRELSDNFCFYNSSYDSVSGFPNWSKINLQQHKDDPRPFLYSLKELENFETSDPLWNAAQKEMVKKGKMHGYMRMYWAKKILEWTKSAEQAMEFSIFLNDKYELDGRDPNGYAGIGWSIGGVHDRAWFRRPIFGLVRYMSYNGAKGKFSIPDYIDYVNSLN